MDIDDIVKNLECDPALIQTWINAERRIPLAISAWLETSVRRGRLTNPPRFWNRGGYSHRVS
ncbi:hypothetical protein ACIQWS_23745 [Phyllobacterium sp. NPDC097923]|uniref:hypothetical protein n=1 Tax=Phyllobacterium sp. NPDC097923 TaxID=3364404 RepID=UPI00383B40E7